MRQETSRQVVSDRILVVPNGGSYRSATHLPLFDTVWSTAVFGPLCPCPCPCARARGCVWVLVGGWLAGWLAAWLAGWLGGWVFVYVDV